MNLNARFFLKCALRTARLTYERCGFLIRPHAQVQPEGAEGQWAGGPSPPPCGQLTRCFSAVAELLVHTAQTETTSESTSSISRLCTVHSKGSVNTPTTSIVSSSFTTVMNSSADQEKSKKSKSATLSNLSSGQSAVYCYPFIGMHGSYINCFYLHIPVVFF